jgi:hypothetical protein
METSDRITGLQTEIRTRDLRNTIQLDRDVRSGSHSQYADMHLAQSAVSSTSKHRRSRCRILSQTVYFPSVIQNDPEGEVNILRGHNISHSKQTVYMYMCPIPNGFRDRAISLYSSRIVDKRDITYCF